MCIMFKSLDLEFRKTRVLTEPLHDIGEDFFISLKIWHGGAGDDSTYIIRFYYIIHNKLISTMPWHIVSRSRSVVSDSLPPHGLYSPGTSQGQNTGVGSHSLLQVVSQPRDQTRSPALQVDSLPAEPPGKPLAHCKYLKNISCYYWRKSLKFRLNSIVCNW